MRGAYILGATAGPAALAGLPGLAADVPVDPDAETARRWAVTELSDPIYHRPPSLLDLLLDWLRDQLDRISEAATGLDPLGAGLIIGSLLLVVVVIALIVAGPVRRARAARRASVEVFGADTRSAADLRASADQLAAEGRWGDAVLDRFRALLRSLEDRALLDERPGRTAHEASVESARLLPGCGDDLHAAGRLFDDVCYGHAVATADDDAWLRSVDQRVAATRPEASAAVPVDTTGPS